MNDKTITKAQRNYIKNVILKSLTCPVAGIYSKKDGKAKYNGIDIEMVIKCVFNGLCSITCEDKPVVEVDKFDDRLMCKQSVQSINEKTSRP